MYCLPPLGQDDVCGFFRRRDCLGVRTWPVPIEQRDRGISGGTGRTWHRTGVTSSGLWKSTEGRLQALMPEFPPRSFSLFRGVPSRRNLPLRTAL